MTNIARIPMFGETGNHIKTLQSALIAKGISPGPVDGIFGGKTRQAVITAQKAAGLPGGGIIGPKTLAFLGLQVMPINPVTDVPTITRDLKGRKARSIHPTLRVMIENKVFPGGVIPQAFKDRDLVVMANMLCLALESFKIREVGGNNRGKNVGLLQDIIGGYVENGNGDAWCMSLVQVIIAFIEDFLQIESPVLDSEGCMVTLAAARKVPGLLSGGPEAGTAFLAQHGKKTAGHTGWVLQVLANQQIRTFEGNTGGGSESDGSGAFFKTRGSGAKFASGSDLHIVDYVRIFPYNKIPQGV